MADYFPTLVKATCAIYLSSLSEAWRGFRRNWWIPLFHFVLIIPLSFLFQTLSFLFSGIAGSFIAGLLMAALLSCYLATVSVAAKKEKITATEIWPETLRFFNPVISVLFLLFLVTFLLQMTVARVNPLLMIGVNIAISVFLNPLPEEIITRGGSGVETVRESFNFILENFVEWFIPWMICFLIVIAPFAGATGALGMVIFTEPLALIRSLFFLFDLNAFFTNPSRLVLGAAVFYLLYLVFIFRAVLYYKLSTSTRRKRVYQFKMGELEQ